MLGGFAVISHWTPFLFFRAFSGVTVGVIGGLIGIHWSLAISAMILLAITIALFALVIPGRSRDELR